MTQPNVTIEPALHSLEQLHTFRRPEEVGEFLHEHPFLVPVLAEAHGQIGRYFEPTPEITLEVSTDPEVRGLVELLGYIATPLTPEEAGKQLQQSDREWLLRQVHRTGGLLNFDVEFR